MKKSTKKVLGAVVGIGTGVLALGETFYQGVLNIRFKQKTIDKTGLLVNEEEDKFWRECEIYQDGIKWFKDSDFPDTIIRSRLGRDTHSVIIPADKETDRWAIVIHGYTADPTSMSHYAWKYHEMGYNVLMPHMLGHGNDPSKYCTMGFYDRYMILDWIDYIVDKNPNAKILMHGVSMGSATTMLVTGEPLPENVVAAVADCGYTSCWDEYAVQINEMFKLPVVPFLPLFNKISKLHKNFDFKECAPIKAVAKSKTPTLFIHGADDDFVPYRMMEPLYNACTAEKKMLTVNGAFHANSVFVENELYWNTVNNFVNKYFDETKAELTA